MLKIPVIKSDFTRNVVKLFSGTAFAHVATFIATPILTRLFTKENLGDWQIFISTITTFGVIASLKYEMAIVLPKEDREGNDLALLSLLALLLFSVLFSMVLLFLGPDLLHWMNADSLQPFLHYIALGVFLFGLWQAVQYILVRRKRFGVLALNKVVQVASTQVLAVLFGVFWTSSQALLIAQVLGYLLASVIILRMHLVVYKTRLADLWRLAKQYRKFPTINTSMVFLNTLSLQLPVFMLSRFFGPEIVALYSMADRIVNIPLFMVGRSVQQVYFASASEAMHNSKEALIGVYKSTVQKLALFAVIPLLFILLLGPQFASLYFGSDFAEAGVYMQIITFWMFFRFINSPISSTFSIINRQEVGFYLIAASLILRLLAMFIFNQTPRSMLLALSITAGLFYLFYNISIYYFIKHAEDYDQ
ncbi:MAG: oligosaccharide flippase family protein [candidate division KSB1 bacterium]|nr:oligosaccharide flippase family protein [candidate division KSB1 bacterium]